MCVKERVDKVLSVGNALVDDYLFGVDKTR